MFDADKLDKKNYPIIIGFILIPIVFYNIFGLLVNPSLLINFLIILPMVLFCSYIAVAMDTVRENTENWYKIYTFIDFYYSVNIFIFLCAPFYSLFISFLSGL